MQKPGNSTQRTRSRLFVDMDGTLAQWRNITIEIPDSENASPTAIAEALDEVLYLPGYYADLLPHTHVVDAVNAIIESGVVEVFVMSCCKPDKEMPDGSVISPRADKNAWVSKFLPKLDEAHRIFVPDGEDKSEYVPGGIREDDHLLDDYTHNLELWAKRGRGIKLLNQVNSSKGTWGGSSVSYMAPSEEIALDVLEIIQTGALINHPQPAKNRESVSNDKFKELHKIFSIANDVAVVELAGASDENSKRVRDFVSEHGIGDWNTFRTQGADGTRYVVFFRTMEELSAEIEMTLTKQKVQKIIPDEIMDSLMEFESSLEDFSMSPLAEERSAR